LNVTRNQAQITWSLNTQHPDEEAETLTLTLEFVNGTLVEQHSLAGNSTQQRVNTIPGIEYRVTLTASNQDGTRTADPVRFQTPAGGGFKLLCEVHSTTQIRSLIPRLLHIQGVEGLGMRLQICRTKGTWYIPMAASKEIRPGKEGSTMQLVPSFGKYWHCWACTL